MQLYSHLFYAISYALRKQNHAPWFLIIYLSMLLACPPGTLHCEQESNPLHLPQLTFQKIEERLNQADELLDAGLHHLAISAYQEILQNNPNEINPQLTGQIHLHLAQSYFTIEKYEEALNLLEAIAAGPDPLSSEMESLRENSLYLTALTYKNMNQYDQASEALTRYLNLKHGHFLPLQAEAHFELGLIHFLKGALNEAKNSFEILELTPAHHRLHLLTKLYLARIDLAKGNLGQAGEALAELAKQTLTSDELLFEVFYFQGETFFQMQAYPQALHSFKQALPKNHPERCTWYCETLYHIGLCCLKIGDDPLKTKDLQDHFFIEAEKSFLKLLEFSTAERVYLALAQCYLSRAGCLKEEAAYAKAEALLSQGDLFFSRDAQTHALLLRAEATSSHAVRDTFYRQLTHEANRESAFFSKGWYLRALNDFEEGKSLVDTNHSEEGQTLLERSAWAFERAWNLLKEHEKSLAGSALKYQALAIGNRNNRESSLKAFAILDQFIENDRELLNALDNPDEIYYLHGFFATRLAQGDTQDKFASIAERSLTTASTLTNCKFGDIALNHLGSYLYTNEKFIEAEASYLKLLHDFPSSPHAAEAWYWTACCADKLQKPSEIGKERKSRVFTEFPTSPFAAEAYFAMYSYQDYLQGNRNTVKHLQSLIKKFPVSPLFIQVYYLIGLDYKRDRKTDEGKWIRKRNLNESIDAFQNVETLFDTLVENEWIPADQLDYYTAIYYRAILERAMANFAIASESTGAKRKIYLEYAEEVFKHILTECNTLDRPHAKLLFQGETYPPIYEESAFWLAQTYIKGHQYEQAAHVLSEMIDHYRQAKITRGYYLSRVWYEQSQIAMRNQAYEAALQCLKLSEDASKGNILGTDQKLELWIQQSMCHRGQNQFDDAILILSKVINDDAVSALRLKAMFLRSEIYELQKRPELARKQLDSLAKKGGPWALKAKEILEKNYGY